MISSSPPRRGIWAAVIVSLALLHLPSFASAQKRQSTADRLVASVFTSASASLSHVGGPERTLAWTLSYEAPTAAGVKDRLETVIGGLIEARLAAAGFALAKRIDVPAGSDRRTARRRARAVGADVLARAELFEKRNHLHLVVELYEVPVGFWTRLRKPMVGVRAYHYGAVRIDAELRAIMDLRARAKGATRFELKRAHPILQGSGNLFGAAIADLDGDGFQEVVLLERSVVRAVRVLPGEAPVELGSFPLDGLARADQPSRDAFGHVQAADFTGDHRAEVALWTSDLATGHVLRWTGSGFVLLRFPGDTSACGHSRPKGSPVVLCGPPLAVVPPLAQREANGSSLLVGEVPPGKNHLSGKMSSWALGRTETPQVFPDMHWALFGYSLKLAGSGDYTDLLGVVSKNGELKIRAPGQTWRLGPSGVAGTLCDFDDDGQAELVRTAWTREDEPDAIVVHRLKKKGATPRLWRVRSKPVLALAPGDFDNDGRPEVLVATAGGGVRVLRTK